MDHRRGVEQFMRGQTGHGAAVDVSNVINTRLQRAQVHALQFFEDFRHGLGE